MPDPGPRAPSLDQIIEDSAVVVAAQIQAAAAWAQSEMDLQIEVVAALNDFAGRAHISLRGGHHNVTIATGRPDSVYGSVIVEYKEPGSLSPNLDAARNQGLVEQLKSRFQDLEREERRDSASLLGVGTDGAFFIFLRYRDGQWSGQEPLPVNAVSTARLLWALYNLGQKGRPFQPEYLQGDFGAESPIAQEGIRALYQEILSTQDVKAQVFFAQWKILFGEVCGFDVDGVSPMLSSLGSFYGLTGQLHPAHLLFAIHTYYGIFIKILAAEIVGFFNPLMPRQVQRLLSATTSAKLRRELEELERGGIFLQMGISNFLEGDLFSWHLSAWSDAIERQLRRMIAKLDEYNPGTFSEHPEQSRDLLKRLYQQLFPKSVRHSLGEYYTPDWLADYTLDEVGYDGHPDRRLLDPACGSGTFLVMAINRVRRWHDEHRERSILDKAGLLKKILANVVGFDLNPLAVMAARTNYLVAIKDLIPYGDGVEIPVYLCDSVMTPAEYGDLFTGSHSNIARIPCSALRPPLLLVPKEIARSAASVAAYASVLEQCVRNRYSPEEFLLRCRDEGIAIGDDNPHLELYAQLVKLHQDNKNGIWARIIKNNFAPLFVGPESFDFVVGNPPWVNWESLPPEYRNASIALWDQYRLRRQGAGLGNVKKELSALFVYACMDHYVAPAGVLGFVITQSVFKTGANEGFRRFACAADRPFAVTSVSDLSLLLPFEGAVNRTAVVVAKKGHPTRYPVRYPLWVPDTPRAASEDLQLAAVRQGVAVREWLAAPVEPSNPQSAWLTASKRALPLLEKVIGDRNQKTMDRTHAGCCTWLNGVYWVEPTGDARRALVRNLCDVGKIKVECVSRAVEGDLLFPLLRGRDVQEWRASPSALILIPHDRQDFSQPLPLSQMRRLAPKAYEYFAGFEPQLRARSGYRLYHDSRPEFYVVGNLGKYSLAPYKVVFKELSEIFQCVVIGPASTAVGMSQPIMPDHKLQFIECQEEECAFYFAGALNSIPARCALHSASTGVQTQAYHPTDVARVRLPDYDPENAVHAEVARIARGLHERAAAAGAGPTPFQAEVELAEAVAPLWRLARAQLKHLIAYYLEIRSLRGPAGAPPADRL